jgi:hypothetical protein
VKPSRLGAGEWLALAGAVVLVVTLFLDTALGWVFLVVVALGAALGLWLAIATASKPPNRSIGDAVIVCVAAALAFLVLLVRALASHSTGATWIAVAALLAVVAGAWIDLRDERTGAPESAFEPPAPRPAPPAAAD